MKKILFASVVAFSLAGCGSTGNKVIDILPQEIQAKVAAACNIAISLEAAARLLSLLVPQVETVSSMVLSFCDAMLPPTAMRVRLKNAPIKGTFRGVTFYGTNQ